VCPASSATKPTASAASEARTGQRTASEYMAIAGATKIGPSG
jgi:hypothetical protein